MTLQLGTLNEAAMTAFTLSLLGEGRKNLDQITSKIKDLSSGRISWTQNSFLPILFKLEHSGYIESLWIRDEVGGRERVYQITDMGKREVMKEQEKWEVTYSILSDLLNMRIQRNYLIAG